MCASKSSFFSPIFRSRAIKTGLLFSPEIVETVAVALERCAGKIPLIVDPVMIATSGDALLQPAAVEFYCSRLFPRATLVTPNMAEAAALTGRPVRDLDEMRTAGSELAQKFGTRFLLKGGHLGGDQRDRPALRRSGGGGILSAVCPGRFDPRHRMHLFRGDRGPPRARAIHSRKRSRGPRISSAVRSANIFRGRRRQAKCRP